MIKIILTSDLHEGFDHKTTAINTKFIDEMADEIAKDPNIKVMIIAGDLISHKQSQYPRILKMLRAKITIPILVVKGNHCNWDTKPNKFDKDGTWVTAKYPSIEKLNKQHADLFEKYNIHHLAKKEFIIDGIVIVGWDGWYHELFPPTNDEYHMATYTGPIRTSEYLTKEAEKEFERVLYFDNYQYRKSIVVTHHSPFTDNPNYNGHRSNPKHLQHIICKYDYFITGHTHQPVDMILDKCRIINCGSHYNKPKYVIFEVL
jgi:predicted phosphodiesterase